MFNHINSKIGVKFDRNCLKKNKVTFTHNKVSNVSTYIVYEINLGSYTQGDDVALANYLLGAVELIKNADSGWSAFLLGILFWIWFTRNLLVI